VRRVTTVRPRRGYVLVFVLGALAVISIVAARFAQRIDALRAQTASLAAHAEAERKAGNALAATLYLLATNAPGPGGFGLPVAPHLIADDRIYRFGDGALAQVQDLRGLMPLNVIEREPFTRVVSSFGVPPPESDALYDVLQDYVDTDSLRRLSGAEVGDYAALGRPPPRNDWLLSVGELARMPRWSDRPELLDRVSRVSSTARQAVLNPNTAPLELLRAWVPDGLPQQWALFDTLRRGLPFDSGEAARAATGLALVRDDFVFHLGAQHRITVGAQGSNKTVQYNLTLMPSGPLAPWLISEVHPVHRTRSSDDIDRARQFPLVVPPDFESRSVGTTSEQRPARTEW
jgi:general secretion pathway protein K